MVSKSVLHGDLSPNNLIIYDGKGYFIDFDHAITIGPDENIILTRGTVSLHVMFRSARF
jgi:serine/threonine-protein kinase RIO1